MHMYVFLSLTVIAFVVVSTAPLCPLFVSIYFCFFYPHLRHWSITYLFYVQFYEQYIHVSMRILHMFAYVFGCVYNSRSAVVD